MNQRVIIVGAGHAAAQLAPSLRKYGWEGEILVLGDEPYLPYQRPTLSKGYLSGKRGDDDILIRHLSAYSTHGIDVRTQQQVTSIDREQKKVTTLQGDELCYDKLALCTGSSARRVDIPGGELEGVCYLRSLDDVKYIKQHISLGQQVVIIGGGYIGLETAAVLNGLGIDVTILEQHPRVLARVTAPEVSEFYSRVHTEEGVVIRTGVSVGRIDATANGLSVYCEDGGGYEADLVIVGIGVVPNVALAEACGLTVGNGVVVDDYAVTSDADIVAAGDCTNHPNALLGFRLRLESVQNAVEQANAAAASLCGLRHPYAAHPWFWSDQYDLKLQIAGYNHGYDRVVIRGDRWSGRSFVAWYLAGERLLAADCINRPKEFMVAKQLLARGVPVDASVLSNDNLDPKALLG